MESIAPPSPIRFASAPALIAAAFRHARVPERLDICEAAIKYRRLENPGGGYSGPWNFDAVPHLRRPQNCLMPNSGFSMVAVQGPAQSAKSEIGNNWMLWTPICDPADMLFIGPDKAILADYIVQQIDKMLRLSEELRKRQLTTSSADNRFLKQFLGCNWFMAWPVASQLRARPVPRIRIDDYDALPEDIDGEGNALMLASGRQTTFEGFEMTYVNSSPALGADRGIEAVRKGGTDESWHVPCRECGEYFALNFEEHLHFRRDGSPDDAKASAVVVCPACGGIHEQRHKTEMMARGDWVGPDQVIYPDGTKDGELRRTSVASFLFDGLMGFASWGRLAELWRSAEITFERTQDESELQSFYNARGGRNYKRRYDGQAPIEAHELAARCEDYAIGTVPAGVRFLTAAVDTQGNRFEVMVVGWGPDYESWIIDRFAIRQLADGRTDLAPGSYPEHWDALVERVLTVSYPVAADPETRLPIAITAIDTGGIDGVTTNARLFYRRARRRGIQARQLMLVKGASTLSAPALRPPSREELDKRGNKIKTSVPLYVIGVHALKNTVANRLRRAEPGPGYVHYPDEPPPRFFEELTAEERTAKGAWERKKEKLPNETWDLAVYNAAAAARRRPEKINWQRPPAWCLTPGAPDAAEADEGAAPAPRDEPMPEALRPRPARPARGRPAGFVNGWRIM